MYVYKMKKKKGAQRLQVANQQTTTLVSRSNISASSMPLLGLPLETSIACSIEVVMPTCNRMNQSYIRQTKYTAILGLAFAWVCRGIIHNIIGMQL
jgi:hypothetical protein